MYPVDTRFKEICWEPREGCDSHMKMMEYLPPHLELIMDYACGLSVKKY